MVDNEVDSAPLGLSDGVGIPFRRALPYAIDYKAFSLMAWLCNGYGKSARANTKGHKRESTKARRREGAKRAKRAESPITISVGQRPTEQIAQPIQALKGRNPDYAPLGLSDGMGIP